MNSFNVNEDWAPKFASRMPERQPHREPSNVEPRCKLAYLLVDSQDVVELVSELEDEIQPAYPVPLDLTLVTVQNVIDPVRKMRDNALMVI